MNILSIVYVIVILNGPMGELYLGPSRDHLVNYLRSFSLAQCLEELDTILSEQSRTITVLK